MRDKAGLEAKLKHEAYARGTMSHIIRQWRKHPQMWDHFSTRQAKCPHQSVVMTDQYHGIEEWHCNDCDAAVSVKVRRKE